jgi:ATP-dependent Zn protease
MIREFAMSDAFGAVYVSERAASGGAVAARVSEVAEGIVRAQLDRGGALLEEHRSELDRLAAELLERNRLTRADLEAILGAPPGPTEPPVKEV